MATMFAELDEEDIMIAEILEDTGNIQSPSDLIVTQLSCQATGGNLDEYTSSPTFKPAADALVIADIFSISVSGSFDSPISVEGNGLTWELIDLIDTGAGGRLLRYRAMGAAPTLGALTVRYATDRTAHATEVYQIAGVNTGGSNGSGALGAVTKAAGNGDSMALAIPPPIEGSIVSFASFGSELTSDPDFTPINMLSRPSIALNSDFNNGTEVSYAGQLVGGDFAGIMTEIIKA